MYEIAAVHISTSILLTLASFSERESIYSWILPTRCLFEYYIAIIDWWYGLSIAEGALTSLFLGTSPVIAENQINGKFYRPFGYLLPRNKYPKLASNELAEKLWDWTEDFVSMKETEIRLQSRGG